MIPKTIGRYRIKAEIGRGGMSTVYLAHDPRFERDVAVKLLPHELLGHATFRRRFEREAKVVAALDHPAIVPVYDFGEQDGQPYLVMRFMTGGSLSDRLRQNSISFKDAARIINRLAPALDEVHAHHVIHRDLKPSNILFDQRDEPYISDFGTAKFMDAQTRLTQTGGSVGTPAYMSPEQIQGETVLDGRSDIYALGVVLFEMLTGKHPYDTNTPIGIAMKHVFEPIPRILETQPNLPAACQAVLTRAMAKNRDERYPTAVAFAEAVGIVGQFLEAESDLPGIEQLTARCRRFALLICNNSYEDATLSRLVKPTADLIALEKVLCDPQIGRFDEVIILQNETADATRRAISHFLAEKKQNDLVLVYFIGHAALDIRGQVYLAVCDTEHEMLRATAVSNAFLSYELNNCPAYEQVLILDCHYSSTGTDKTPHLIGKAVDTGTSFTLNGRNRVILTASDITHYVWYDNEVVGRASESRFTHHLIHGLQGGKADGNGNGRITVDELFEYVRNQLALEEKGENPAQLPRKWSYNEQTDILVAHRPQPAILPVAASPSKPAQKLEPHRSSPGGILPRRFPKLAWVSLIAIFSLLLVAGASLAWQPPTPTPVSAAVIAPTHTVPKPTVTPRATSTATPTQTAVPTATPTTTVTPTTAVSLPTATSTATHSMTTTAVLPSSIYAQPDSTSTELGFIESGALVIILGRSPLGQWYYVQTGEQMSGYIYAPRLEWAGDFESLPIIAASTATTTSYSGTAVCANKTCPVLQADIYPLDGSRCENGVIYRTVYLQGYGGNGVYTYYWSNTKVAGPLTNQGFGFEVNNANSSIVIGTGKVVSGDGQSAERELFISDFNCN